MSGIAGVVRISQGTLFFLFAVAAVGGREGHEGGQGWGKLTAAQKPKRKEITVKFNENPLNFHLLELN